jgi:pyruvate formate lyase activating enzyme
VYVGNVHDDRRNATLCPSCGAVVLTRAGMGLAASHMHGGACDACGATIAGRGLP